MKSNLQIAERRRLIESERQTKAKEDALYVVRSIEERRALPTGSDIEPEIRTRAKLKPPQRLDGLDFLAKQKVVSPEKYQAGRRWSALFGLLETGDLQSAMNCQEVKTQVRDLDPVERRIYARLKLDIAKNALGHHVGMINALNCVCGQGARPSELPGDRRSQEKAVSFLDCALTILAKHWVV